MFEGWGAGSSGCECDIGDGGGGQVCAHTAGAFGDPAAQALNIAPQTHAVGVVMHAVLMQVGEYLGAQHGDGGQADGDVHGGWHYGEGENAQGAEEDHVADV